jgi:hypothetical protein
MATLGGDNGDDTSSKATNSGSDEEHDEHIDGGSVSSEMGVDTPHHQRQTSCKNPLQKAPACVIANTSLLKTKNVLTSADLLAVLHSSSLSHIFSPAITHSRLAS